MPVVGKHHSSDYKLAAVKYYINNKIEKRKICDIFKCKRESLRTLIVKYLQTGTVVNKPRQEGSYKIRKKHIKFIHNLLAKFHEKFNNITLSKSHLVGIIKICQFNIQKI